MLIFLEKFLSRFERPVGRNDTPQEVFARWRIIKRKTRFWLCVAASGMFYLGLAQASPGYSLLDEIARKNDSIATEGRALTSAIVDLFFILKYTGDALEIGPKLIVVSGAFVLFWTVIGFRDQFANDARLRRLRLSGPRSWRGVFATFPFEPIRRDVEAYAQVLPSNKLQNLCPKCTHSYRAGCSNRITDTDRFVLNESYRLWNKISHSIDPITLNEILKETHWCRLSFHGRLLLLLLGYLFLSIYLIHRAIELIVLDIPPKPNYILLAAIVVCFALTWVIGFLFGTEVACESRWDRLAKKVSEALKNNAVVDAYSSAYISLVCSRDNSKLKFSQNTVAPEGCIDENFHKMAVRLLDSLIDYLNRHVTTKLSFVAAGKNAQKRCQDDFIKRCIIQLEKFFEANFQSEIFRAYIAKPSTGNFGTFLDEQKEERFVGMVSDGVRRFGFFCKSSTECDEVGVFPEEYRSLFVLPLDFSEEHQEDLSRSVQGYDRFGHKLAPQHKAYVVITSTNEHRFVSENALMANMNHSLIYPFVHRAAFETVRSELNRRNGK